MPWNCFRQSLRRSRNCETFSAVAGKIMMLGRGHKKTWHGSSRHEASRDITPRHDTSHPQLGSDRMVNTGPGPGCHHASDLTIDLNHFLCWRLGWAGLVVGPGATTQIHLCLSLRFAFQMSHLPHSHNLCWAPGSLHAGALHANAWFIAAWTQAPRTDTRTKG